MVEIIVVCIILALVCAGRAIDADNKKEILASLIIGAFCILIAIIIAIVDTKTPQQYKVIRTYESYAEYTLLILEDSEYKTYEVYSEDYYGPGEIITFSLSDLIRKEIKILPRGQAKVN